MKAVLSGSGGSSGVKIVLLASCKSSWVEAALFVPRDSFCVETVPVSLMKTCASFSFCVAETLAVPVVQVLDCSGVVGSLMGWPVSQ